MSECRSITQGAMEVISMIDSPSTMAKLKEIDKVFVSYERTEDRDILRHASEAMNASEESLQLVAYIFNNRNMEASDAVRTLNKKAKITAARFDKTLWDLAISEEDKKIMRSLFNKLGVLIRINEDVPAPLVGRDYNSIKTDVSGLITFSHCFGYTFIEYKCGKAITGWSVAQESMEQAIRQSKYVGVTEACALLK